MRKKTEKKNRKITTKQRLVQVQESEDAVRARLAAIVHSSHDAIVSIDLGGRITSWNKSAERVFGFSEDDVLGRHISMYIPKKRQHEEYLILDRIRLGERVEHYETQRLRKDGAIIDVALSVSPIMDDSGAVVGASKILTDISVLKRTSEALKESEKRFELVAEKISVGIMISRVKDGVIMFANPAFHALIRARPGSLIGANAVDLYNRTFDRTRLMSRISVLRSVQNYEIKIRRMDSSIAWISVTVNAIKYMGTRVHIGAAVDITDKKFAEVQQFKNQQELEYALKSKEDFLSMASHELRTPVTSLKAYAQLLHTKIRKNKDRDVRTLVTKFGEQINELTGLISDLFDDTKVKEGKLELVMEKTDINKLITETVDDIRHAHASHAIQVEKKALPFILCDKARIKQVLLNIVTNAIKYSPRAKKVVVSTESAKTHVIIRVQDFGVGISRENQKNIFSRFYRVKSETLDTYPGLGLGLYISSDIVARHGGRISVKSQPGSGSTFAIYLPIKKRINEEK